MIFKIGLLRSILVLAIGWSMVSDAQEMEVPVNLQAALFSKVLPFNRSISWHAQGKITIGVVYQSRFKMSVDARRDFVEAMASLPGGRIGDMPFYVVEIDVNTVGLEGFVLDHSVDVLYITPLRAFGVDQITAVSRTRDILTLTGIPEYVQEGISVGIGTKAGKPQVLINLRSARLEHADFSSQFLKISRIVDSEEAQ